MTSNEILFVLVGTLVIFEIINSIKGIKYGKRRLDDRIKQLESENKSLKFMNNELKQWLDGKNDLSR